MSEPVRSQSFAERKVIQNFWDGLGSQPDILPQDYFASDGHLSGVVHEVGASGGNRSRAQCDITVKGTVAELNYEPYATFNRSQGMELGVTRLTFTDESRTKILSTEWKPKGSANFQRSSSEQSPGPLQESSASRSYYRVMLGKKSVHAAECFARGFIGTDFEIDEDLTGKLPDDWREFNRKYIPVYLSKHPGKTKIGAGLACGFLWTVSKGIKIGDVVLAPDGGGQYRVGEVTGDYYYAPGEILFHRRPVRWTDLLIARSSMSKALRGSAGSSGTVSDLSSAGHNQELNRLVSGTAEPVSVPTDNDVEDQTVFGLEKHLQEFLVHNWKSTEFGKSYDIYRDENSDGEQVKADNGYIDILAVSKDKKELLVVELKKGRASDVVVGQIQRYMGYVLDELAGENQKVRGVIVALEDDQRIRRAMRVTQNIEFYRYEVSFRLFKA